MRCGVTNLMGTAMAWPDWPCAKDLAAQSQLQWNTIELHDIF
jgi:hypothetical protein